MPYLSKIRLNGVVYDLKAADDSINEKTPTFEQASTRTNIASGETISTLFGKIMKFFADLKTVAFTGKYSDLSGLPTVPTKTSQLTNDSEFITGSGNTSGSAGSTKKLSNYFDSRPTSGNFNLGDGSLRKFCATSSMTDGKPTVGDGNVIHLAWDNTGGWDGQIAVPTSQNESMQFRHQVNGNWEAWRTLIDSVTIGSQSVAKADNVSTPRSTSGNYNDDLPGANKTKFVEHGPSSPNRPSDHWYYVITMQGGDSAYATQLAYGMTTTNNYSRAYQNGTWTSWKAFKSQADIDAAVSAAKVGNAAAGDVRSGKTFTNSSSSGLTGTFAGQEKTVTAGTSAASVTPDSGKWLSKVTYNPTPSQSKSASPSTSAQTIKPDSGKLLSSVSISAISPQRSAGTSAVASGVDSTGPYVYFPYGWWPSGGNDRQYCRMSAAQAVAACPKQEKTVTGSRSAQTVTPDSGKLLSKVTVNKYPDASGTFTTSTNSSAVDMGSTNNYRYVNTNGVYNKGISHVQSNRSGFCSGFFKDNDAEYRFDIYDVLAGTTISITTDTDTMASTRFRVEIRDLSNWSVLASQGYFDKYNSLTYKTTTTRNIAIVAKRTSAWTTNDFHYWWSLSNSNY